MNEETKRMAEELEAKALQDGDLTLAAICQIATNGKPRISTIRRMESSVVHALAIRFGDYLPGAQQKWRQALAEQECIKKLRLKSPQ